MAASVCRHLPFDALSDTRWRIFGAAFEEAEFRCFNFGGAASAGGWGFSVLGFRWGGGELADWANLRGALAEIHFGEFNPLHCGYKPTSKLLGRSCDQSINSGQPFFLGGRHPAIIGSVTTRGSQKRKKHYKKNLPQAHLSEMEWIFHGNAPKYISHSAMITSGTLEKSPMIKWYTPAGIPWRLSDCASFGLRRSSPRPKTCPYTFTTT